MFYNLALQFNDVTPSSGKPTSVDTCHFIVIIYLFYLFILYMFLH